MAQLVPILLQPVIRRVFLPEAFGVYSVYLSVIGIIITITSLKFELAIVLPKKRVWAINLLGLTLVLSFIICSILQLITIWKQESLNAFFNISSFYSNTIYFLPLGAFLITINQNFNFFLIRQKDFLGSSINKVSRRAAEGVLQLTFGYSKVSYGLVFSDVIGNFVNLIIAIFQSYRKGFSFRLINYKGMKEVAIQYQDYPRYNLIPSLLSASAFLLPVIIINKTFSAEMAGYFDLSKLLLSIPLALISRALSNVLLQRVSAKYLQRESLLSDLKPIFYFVLLIALLEVLIVLLFGKSLFVLFFGQNWGFSGEISKTLVWSYALNFILAPFTDVLIALRKIKTYSYWQVSYFAAIISLFFLKSVSFTTFLLYFISIEIFCYIFLAILIFVQIRRYEDLVTKPVF